MMKRIGRPILLCVIAVAGILSTAIVASASSGLTTSTVVVSVPSTPVVGQSVTYTATVSYTGGAGEDPTGTVTFTDLLNSTPGCTSATLQPINNPATGGMASATCTTTYTKAESGTFTALYGGDTNYAGSSGSISPQTIGKGSTTTAIAASTTTPVSGQSVVFTATVKAVTGTAATPTGTVVFTEEAGTETVPNSCATAALSGSGGTATATCTVVFTGGGSGATMNAAYGGDGNFTGSTDATDVVVAAPTAAATRVIITSSVSPSVSGQPVTFTATVVATAPGSGIPQGTLTFSGFTGCTSSPTLSSAGSATCTAPAGTLLAGNSAPQNTVTASYGGSSFYTGSTSSFPQAVVQNTSTTTLIASPAKPVAGGPLTLTAVILGPPPGSGAPTGNVTFVIAGKNSGPLSCNTISVFGGASGTNINNVALSGSSSNEVTCSLSVVPASANPLKVTVTYAGDANYFGSSSKTAKIRLS